MLRTGRFSLPLALGYADCMDLKDASAGRMSDGASLDALTLPRADAPIAALAPARSVAPHEDHLPQADDATLMLRYRDGDVRAFEILYQRYKGPLYRYLTRLCRNSEAVNDIYQDVWSKVIASRDRYEVRAQFNTFLYRIAHNAAIDHFRRSGRTPEDRAEDAAELEDQLPASPDAQPESQAAQMEVRASFQRALAQLPAEQRDVFLLYEETGLSLEQIGQVTGVAMETAKSRLRYAVSKLRTALHAYRPSSPESVQS